MRARYYVMTLRASERNRRIQLVSQMSNDLINLEGYSKYFDLLNMEWRDYDDFEKKYGSDFNVHAASQRFSVWLTFNKLGYMLSKGLVDAEDIYEMGGMNCIQCWAKLAKGTTSGINFVSLDQLSATPRQRIYTLPDLIR